MPYYLDTEAGSDFTALQDFRPTGGQAFGAQFEAAFAENPTVLGLNALRVAAANRNGERLSAYDAGKIATDAGLRDFAPGDGEYTREALGMVIERKREQRQREDVIGRTPWSFAGSPLRGVGMLGATLLDPLNVGSAFVPVVREARYSALLRAAGGGIERAAVRAGVGAVEGTVGMAALEPLIYGAHQYLDDDYTMRDSLLNIAFGGLLGGGLHVVGGRVADALNPRRWDAVRTIDDAIEQSDLPGATRRTDVSGVDAGSAADIAARVSPETRRAAMTTAVGQIVEGKVPNVEPIVRGEQLPKHVTAGDSIAIRAMVEDVVAGREPAATTRAIRYADPSPEVVAVVREATGVDVSKYRHSIDSASVRHMLNRHGVDGEVIVDQFPITADDIARIPEIVSSPDRPPTHSEHKTTKGIVYSKTDADGVTTYVEEVRTKRRELAAKSMWKARTADPLLRDAVAPASRDPYARSDSRNLPLADASIAELRAVAARQASPESSITADFAAAKAADERLAAAPKNEDVAAAQASAEAAGERLAAARADMEARGASQATLKAYDQAAKEADAMVADAESLGRAVEAAASCAARGI